MITIGFSTREIDEQFIEHLKKSSGVKNVEIIPFENKGTHSLTEAYNILLDKATNDIVVLCHDDIYFDTKNWGRKLLKHFNRNPDYGILGVAGSKYMPRTGMWWEVQTEMVGIVNHEHEGRKWTSKYSEDIGNKINDTIIVDGLFMVVNKPNIKKNFNTEVKGFHFYDVDFCFRNFLEDVKIGVFFDVRITHKSIGMTNGQWEKNRQQFAQSYESSLPILLPTTFTKKKPKKSEPLVTISLLIHNQSKRLNSTIESIFKQDYTNFEIIIINDHSTDEYCLMKLTTLKDHQSINVFDEKNEDPFKSRISSIKEGNGEFILSLDEGDMVLPGYIKSGVSIIKNNPKISPVYCDIIHIGKKQGLEQKQDWSLNSIINETLIIKNSIFSKESYEKSMKNEGLLDENNENIIYKNMSNIGLLGKRIPKGLMVKFNY